MSVSTNDQQKQLWVGLALTVVGILSIALQIYARHSTPIFDQCLGYLFSSIFIGAGLTLVSHRQKWKRLLRGSLLVTVSNFFVLMAGIVFKPGTLECTYQNGRTVSALSGLACRLPFLAILLLFVAVSGIAYRQNRETFFKKLFEE